MKVYVIQCVYDYEGSEISSIYLDKSLADERCKALNRHKRSKNYYYEVTEYEVIQNSEQRSVYNP